MVSAAPDGYTLMVVLHWPVFASDDASFITGQVVSVSGGLTMNG